MGKNAKIYVAGHRGLAGSAIVRQLQIEGYTNLILKTHVELDLIDQAAANAFFDAERPDYVILAAAKVGGILANNTYPADFIYRNLAIQTNVIHESWRTGVKRLLFLGSSCIYPRDCPQPIKEENLMTGPLEPTNRSYALAKIAGIEMCSAYNRQYGSQFLAVMPTNLYGPGDNYDLQSAHVLPALIRKMHEAKTLGDTKVTVWGTGTPRREFLYSDDMADACIRLMELSSPEFKNVISFGTYPLVNIGCGEDSSIAELARLIAGIVGFKGKLVFDSSKPDGTPRKLLDVSLMRKLGWAAKIPLEDGIRKAYEAFLNLQASFRIGNA
jgi:GDP-L-fucose synthase